MKQLDLAQLSTIVGGEPHGTNSTGRQNDGYDIAADWDIAVDRQPSVPYRDGYSVYVRYDDNSTDYIFSDGSMKRTR
jgi:hypothetical protein